MGTNVTVAEVRRFVEATGYVTMAGHPPRHNDPDADPALLVPGPVVFCGRGCESTWIR